MFFNQLIDQDILENTTQTTPPDMQVASAYSQKPKTNTKRARQNPFRIRKRLMGMKQATDILESETPSPLLLAMLTLHEISCESDDQGLMSDCLTMRSNLFINSFVPFFGNAALCLDNLNELRASPSSSLPHHRRVLRRPDCSL
ncbi:hypothetical protein BLNAU_22842 [Blattamonas nauphoetae]|uniref:Uncharacterized protein n=1 Tax=Blattamonas nauphoetae TaxID=2049346 RepID=A0ABQ9WW27_9EUKA|nr:hypothetical protein BLNAU_22842 [Blattamonas nauphoetae]